MIDGTAKIAFLVVCWNNREIIDQCLQSIQSQIYASKDIYVIDNASADESARYIAENYPGVHLIVSGKNNGFAKGNNMLIKEALKDKDVGYVALINSDAVLDEDWGHQLIKFLSLKKDFACAQGITLDYYNHDVVDAEHVYLGVNFQSVQYGYGEQYKREFAYPRRVFGVNAAAALYSAAFIKEQPNNVLFDEKFYMYLEDVDVSFRAVVTGWANYYVPLARAYHMGSISAKKRSNSYNIYMTFRNQTALITKNMPIHTFITFLPQALKFEAHFYRHLYKTKGRQTMLLAIKGRVVGVLRAPLYTVDRLRITRRRSISSQQLERIMRSKGIY